MNYNKNTNQKIRTHIKWAEKKMENIGKNTDSKWRKKSKKKNDKKRNEQSHQPNEENNYFHATWRRIFRIPCMSTYFHDLNGSLRLNFCDDLLFYSLHYKNGNNYEQNYVLFIAACILLWKLQRLCLFFSRATTNRIKT